MAHSLPGAPLLVRTSNDALRPDAPLVCMEKWKKINTSGALSVRCAISVFHTNGASAAGAPLVYSSGALLTWCTISINPIYSPFPSSVVWNIKGENHKHCEYGVECAMADLKVQTGQRQLHNQDKKSE